MSEKRFNVYDKVWIMRNDRPQEYIVYSVTERMAFFKSKVEIDYRLVSGVCGASYDTSFAASADQLFETKQELIESL